MIHPAPTTKIDPRVARGVLVELGPVVAGHHHHLVVEFPNTNYRLRFDASQMIRGEVGKRILGTLHAQARRIDVVSAGGRYVEPVYGPPRRVQGSIVAIEPDAIVVHAGIPIHCTPTERDQRPSDFEIGQFVSFDVLPGATFHQVSP